MSPLPAYSARIPCSVHLIGTPRLLATPHPPGTLHPLHSSDPLSSSDYLGPLVNPYIRLYPTNAYIVDFPY